MGVAAGFWHIHWIAGVGLLASAMVAIGVHSAGWTSLELNVKPSPKETESTDAPEP